MMQCRGTETIVKLADVYAHQVVWWQILTCQGRALTLNEIRTWRDCKINGLRREALLIRVEVGDLRR